LQETPASDAVLWADAHNACPGARLFQVF
jgi:hypothetical protein